MVDPDLEIYCEGKVVLCLDILDELRRLERLPGAPGIVRQNAAEARPAWQREFALAEAQYQGVIDGAATLPPPTKEMTDRLSALSDQVEQQINANQAANVAIDAAKGFLDMVAEFQKLA